MIHTFIHTVLPEFREKNSIQSNLVFFTDFSSKKDLLWSETVPLFTCTAKKERIPLPAPRSMANFPWKSSGFSTWVETPGGCRRNQRWQMSKKQSRLVTTLNSPKIRSQTACNLSRTATRKNMTLKHSFNKNTPCNTVRSVKPNFEIAIPTYWYAIQPTTQHLRGQRMLPWIYYVYTI